MLSREWIKAFLPIGVLEESGSNIGIIGAGFLYFDPPVIWLITAAHVISGAAGQRIVPVLTHKNGGRIHLDLNAVHETHDLRWHMDEANDVAVAITSVHDDMDIKAVARHNFLPAAELIPSMCCYTVGCPYQVTGFDPASNAPLVMDGIVSGLDFKARKIFTSAATFPGNSGGPLVVYKSPVDPGGGMVIGSPVIFVAGVMKGLHVIGDPASGAPPLHLGEAASTDCVLELIESPAAQADKAKAVVANPK